MFDIDVFVLMPDSLVHYMRPEPRQGSTHGLDDDDDEVDTVPEPKPRAKRAVKKKAKAKAKAKNKSSQGGRKTDVEKYSKQYTTIQSFPVSCLNKTSSTSFCVAVPTRMK